tara:strand:+ start:4892 stop:5095 length:204 start_codon:yes stop_codon:yes gene_type:complete
VRLLSGGATELKAVPPESARVLVPAASTKAPKRPHWQTCVNRSDSFVRDLAVPRLCGVLSPPPFKNA